MLIVQPQVEVLDVEPADLGGARPADVSGLDQHAVTQRVQLNVLTREAGADHGEHLRHVRSRDRAGQGRDLGTLMVSIMSIGLAASRSWRTVRRRGSPWVLRCANIHRTTGAVTGSGSSRCARRPQAAWALFGCGPASPSRYPYGGRPDRRVWHQAAAALGPDEQVAAELEGAARRAVDRGAAEVAVAALERAAQLSEDGAARGGRLLLAAELAFRAGRPGRGPALLRAAEALDLPPEEQALLSLLRENFTEPSWSGAPNIGAFVAVAERMVAAGHADLAVESAVTVSFRAWYGNPSQEMRTALTAAAGQLPLAADDPARLEILALADPVAHAPAVLEQISRMRPDDTAPVAMLRIASAASAVLAHNLALGFHEAAVRGLRAQGRLGLLARALVCQTWAGALTGQGRLAASAAEEASRFGRETGQLRWAIIAEPAAALVTAERGELAEAETLAAAAEEELLAMGAYPLLAHVRFVRGRGAVAHQRYAEGLDQLRRAFDPEDIGYLPYVGFFGLSDLVEAAAHTGQRDAALAYLRQLEELAAAMSAPLLQAQAAYARPLVADDDHAEALYQAALERDLAGWPGYRNRMLLWYGRWLRRQRRAAESRAPLRAARDGFDALGSAQLAEIARQELRASGETSRRRVPEAWDQLTPQELQIARMAADGLSNREIEGTFTGPSPTHPWENSSRTEPGSSGTS